MTQRYELSNCTSTLAVETKDVAGGLKTIRIYVCSAGHALPEQIGEPPAE